MSQNIQFRIDGLYQTLKLELDRFSAGQKFFSVRQLIERHRSSRRVVEKALARLEGEKQLRIVPASGIFVEERRRKTHVVTLIRCDWPSEYLSGLETKIEQAISKHSGWTFSRSLVQPTSRREMAELLAEIHGDAILFALPFQRLRPSDVAFFLTLPTPVIFLDGNILCDGVNAIDTQPDYSGMLAADFLIRNGHRKLALIRAEPWSMSLQRRYLGFINYSRLHGIEPLEIDCCVQSGEAACAKAHEKVLAYLNGNGLTFSGCFVSCDYSAFGVISAFKECGLAVPDDVSVIGAGGVASGAYTDPPLTTVAEDVDSVARTVCEGLDDLFSGGRFGVRLVPVTLIERKSVKRINR